VENSGCTTSISNFEVFVIVKEFVTVRNMFLMDIQSCVIEIGNKIKNLTDLIKKQYLTNNVGSTKLSCLCDWI
jgi:hypothetical protein